MLNRPVEASRRASVETTQEIGHWLRTRVFDEEDDRPGLTTHDTDFSIRTRHEQAPALWGTDVVDAVLNDLGRIPES